MRIIGNNPAADNAEITAVASGTLPSGQPVIVNANGTVSVIAQGGPAAGTPVVVTGTLNLDDGNGSVVYDSNSNKIVYAYTNPSNSNYGEVAIGTVSGSSITFGTAVVVASSSSDFFSSTFDTSNSKVVLAYRDIGNSLRATSVVGTVSGTTISFGTPVVFNTGSSNTFSLTFDSTNNKIVIAYKDSNQHGQGVVGTVSGTNISFGSSTAFQSNQTNNPNATYDIASGKTLFSYVAAAESDYGAAKVATVSGTSISFGSRVFFASAATSRLVTAYDSNAGKHVISYADPSSSNRGTSIVATVSGTSVSFGTPVVFDSSEITRTSTTFDSTNNKVVIAYRDEDNSNYGSVIVGTVSGTSISFGTPVVFETSEIGNTYATFDSGSSQTIIGYMDRGNSEKGTAVTFAVSPTNLTAENFIGFAGGLVEVSGSANQVIGSETNFETGGRVEHVSVAYDENAQKVVIAYRDETNSKHGTAIVGTVSGTSISFGTAVVFHADATNYTSVVYDATAQKVVIAYQDDNDSNKGTAIVGTVSGTNISFGSPTVFDTDNAFINTVYDSNAQKIVISYNDGGNSDYGTAVVGTVSGASISFGTPVVFATSDTRINDIAYDSAAQKVVVAYRNFAASDAGTAVVGTVSGTSISFGTPVVFDSGGTDRLSVTYDTVADAVVIFYGDKANSYYGTAIVGTVSGTSISFGTKQVFESAEIREFGATYDAVAQRAVLGYRDVGNTERGTIIAAQVDGTTMTFGTAEVFAQDPRHINATYDSDQERVVFAYDDENASRGRSCVVEVGYENITRAEVASGSKATIDIGSAISTNQVSLTAGQQYFVQTDGTLGLTAADPSVIAGTAVSATDIIVKG